MARATKRLPWLARLLVLATTGCGVHAASGSNHGAHAGSHAADADAGHSLVGHTAGASGGQSLQSDGGILEGALPLKVSLQVGACAAGCRKVTAAVSGGRAPYTFKWSGAALTGAGPHSVCPQALLSLAVRVQDAPSTGGEFAATQATVNASADVGVCPTLPKKAAVCPVPAPTTQLRDTPEGGEVIFDPQRVYVVGTVNGFEQFASVAGIAPLAQTDDAVLGIPIFFTLHIRATDGHLLYSWLGSDQNNRGVITALYEFRRDEAKLSDLQAGETVVRDGFAQCQLTRRGANGGPNSSAHYAVSLDGSVYHSCTLDGAMGSFSEPWYSSTLQEQAETPSNPFNLGSNGRALTGTDQGVYSVYDFATGKVFGSHTAQELFGADVKYAIATRAHDAGYWLAGGPPTYQPGPDIVFASLDNSGAIVSQGAYAALPPGVSLGQDSWSTKWPVIDGCGSYYQFAWLADDAVIVRRPMSGQSDIVYRQSSYDSTHPHQVNPEHLVSGGVPIGW